MMNGYMQYIPDWGMGWGLVFIIAIMVILVGIYVRIRKNSRN